MKKIFKKNFDGNIQTKLALFTLVYSCLLTSTLSQAQEPRAGQTGEIILPVASQGGYLGSLELPERRQSQQAVSNRFGEPSSRHGPFGEPAITRWDYADFSVYFENDAVIHSVLKHRRLDSKPLKTKP